MMMSDAMKMAEELIVHLQDSEYLRAATKEHIAFIASSDIRALLAELEAAEESSKSNHSEVFRLGLIRERNEQTIAALTEEQDRLKELLAYMKQQKGFEIFSNYEAAKAGVPNLQEEREACLKILNSDQVICAYPLGVDLAEKLIRKRGRQ